MENGPIAVRDSASYFKHDWNDGGSSKISKENLELASQAIDEIPMEKRDQSSMMMATHSSKIPEAKERIRKFRQELCEFLEDAKTKDGVYQLPSRSSHRRASSKWI